MQPRYDFRSIVPGRTLSGEGDPEPAERPAACSNAADLIGFVPMRISAFLALASALLSMVAGCGNSSPNGSAAATPTAGAVAQGDVGFLFTIDEIGLGANGYVALKNFSDVAASLSGLYLCQPPDCIQLPGVQVAAGQSALVAVGEGEGLQGVVMKNASLTLAPSDGEIGLYVSTVVDDPAAIRSYLQWGSDPHRGTATAEKAGIWNSGYAPSSATATRLFHNEGGLWLFQ